MQVHESFSLPEVILGILFFMLKIDLMQGCERFSLPEVSLGIFFIILENDLRTLLVCLRSFLEYFFMPENDLGILTGHGGARSV